MTSLKISFITLAFLVIASFYIRDSIDIQQEFSTNATKVQLIDVVSVEFASTLLNSTSNEETVNIIKQYIGEFTLWETSEYATFNEETEIFEKIAIDKDDQEMMTSAINNRQVVIKQIENTILVYTPIYDDYGLMNGVLKSSYEQAIYGELGMLPEITLTVICILSFICAVPVLVALKYLKKINKINREMNKKGFYKTKKFGYSRIAKLEQVFSDMSSRILTHNRNIENIKESYEPFLPVEIIKIFEKDKITDLEVGLKKDANAVVLHVKSTNFLDIVKETDEKEVFEYVNDIFNIIIEEIGSGMLIKFNHVDSEILFNESLSEALKTATKIERRLRKNVKSFDGNEVEYSLVAVKSEINLGIVGSNARSEMLVFAKEKELYLELIDISKNFKTGVLFVRNTRKSKKNTRFIGKTRDGRYIYEDYSGQTSDKINLLNLTREQFEESIDLYEKGKKNSANAGFISILRKNNDDLIAFNYFELCNEEVLVGS